MVVVEKCSAFEDVRPLLVEYEQSLIHELPPQTYDESMVTVAGEYEVIFIALCDGEKAGCAALNRLDDDVAEMKRLYVRPSFRGCGAGKALAEAVIAEAAARGFDRIRLDTMLSMTAAHRLYASLGFRDIPPYHDTGFQARFMELTL